MFQRLFPNLAKFVEQMEAEKWMFLPVVLAINAAIWLIFAAHISMALGWLPSVELEDF